MFKIFKVYSKLEQIKSVKWPSNRVILNYQINATDRSRLTGDQNIQYAQNHFKQVNWTPKNYVHVVHVLIVPLLSLYQCHCFCQIGLLTVVNRWIIQPMQYFPSYRTIILLGHIYNRNRISSHATKSLQLNKPKQSLSS